MEGFEDAMDGVAGFVNICKSAIALRYTASVWSDDGEDVVLMISAEKWRDLDNQINMFMAYMTMAEELEEIQPPTEGEL